MSGQFASLVFLLGLNIVILPVSSKWHPSLILLVMGLDAFCSFGLGVLWEGKLF